jgi:dihydroflavonol-4-reductase
MQILVTGGSGFLGANLVKALLQRGHAVRVLHRAQSSLVALDGLPVEHAMGDILEPDSVARAVDGCDMVFHVAAISSYWRSRREHVYRANVVGTRIVMEACLRAGIARVVHTSSVAAIGIPPPGMVGTEETPFDAVSATFAYADSKRRAEEEVHRAIDRGLPAVIVNPATVLGAGDHYLISGSIVIACARGRLPVVPPGGMCVADVDAVVQGHIAAAERGRIGERYILGGENLSHLELGAMIADVVGRPPPRLVVPRRVLGPVAIAVDAINRVNPWPPAVSGEQIRLGGVNFFFASEKAVRELDYPLMPARGAVEKAYRWYIDHGFLRERQVRRPAQGA